MLNRFEKKIITSIRVIPVLVVLIFSLIITYILSNQNKLYFKDEELKLKKDFIENHKSIVKHEVQVVYDLIKYEKNNTKKLLQDNIKKRVNEAYEIALNIYESNKNKPKTEVKKLIKDALVNIRFNENRGYFFIYDFDGINILHPILKDIEDTNKFEYEDLKGKKVIQSLINISKNENEGYDIWHWNKPDDLDNEYEKIGFVKKFEPYNWFIGTGEYLIDFEKSVKRKVLNRVAHIKYDTEGFVFILDYNGITLNHIRKELINKNLLDDKDSNSIYFAKNIIDIAKKGDGFVEYISTKENKSSNEGIKKIAYVKGFDDWQWAIGSSFNPTLVNITIKEKYKNLQRAYDITKNKIYLTIITVIITIIVLLLIFSRQIEKLFKNYRNKHNLYQNKLKELLSDKSEMLDSSLDTIDRYVSITKTDLKGNIIYATKNFCDGVGYTKEELIGKSHNIVRHPDTNPLIFEDMWRTIKKGNVYKTAIKNRTKSGGEIWFELIINPDFDLENNIVGYTAIRKNITDEKIIKEIKDRLEIRIEKVIEKNKEKDTILAHQSKMAAIGEMLENIAHQWRQPLSVISTAASGLELQREYGLLDEENFEKSMKLILDNTSYLSKTIDNFRDFFTSSNSLAQVNLKNVYKKVKSIVQSNMDNNTIIFIENIEDIEIIGYENELIQVFLNIINNSFDAFNKYEENSFSKYIFIDIYKKKDNAIILIKDNAKGIPEDIKEKIFEPYFTTKHQSIGTGIGLYMCMQLITKQMQGEILVENKEFDYDNKQYFGAQFKIVLPLNSRKKMIKRIKKYFSKTKCYKWDENKTLFEKIENSNADDVMKDMENISNFLNEYNINYTIFDNQNILLDFDK